VNADVVVFLESVSTASSQVTVLWGIVGVTMVLSEALAA
jgi:hypothetical protein